MTVSVNVGPEPIDLTALIKAVSDPACGGTVLFLGTVRTPDGSKEIDALTYEVWPEKVDEILRGITTTELENNNAIHGAVCHRTGDVPAPEVAVGVAASAPHRAEAFNACRAIIERLKEEAPIWKIQDGEFQPNVSKNERQRD